ncbi:MAG: hypothetical protein KBT27_09275 [Prevotellaceae bacterium]|nr:hypothetical protein [Candidatus Faecinaster equi]
MNKIDDITFEMYKSSATRVYLALKEILRGRIKSYVNMEEDMLIIEYTNDEFHFSYEVKEWLNKCYMGFDIDTLVAEFSAVLKRAIINKYFY